MHGHSGCCGQGLLLKVKLVVERLSGCLLLLQHWGLLLTVPVPQHSDEAVVENGLCAGNGLPGLVISQVLN